MSSDSRFFVVAKPVAVPGVCFICKTDANGPFVDTGASDQWLGAFYICQACLTEMSGVLTISESPIRGLQDQAWREGRVEGVKDATNAIRNLLAGINASPMPSGPYAAFAQSDDRVTQDSLDLFDNDGDSVNGSEQGDSPVSVERSDDLSGGSSDGEFSVGELVL